MTWKYGESPDQINRLDTLASQQKSQIDTLVKILHQLNNQNDLVQLQNAELIRQGKELYNQGGIYTTTVSCFQGATIRRYSTCKAPKEIEFYTLEKDLFRYYPFGTGWWRKIF